MKIYCRQCGAAIPAENVNLDKLIAKCDSCDAVFSFADMYEDVHPKKAKAAVEAYADVPMPEAINVYEDDAGRMIIERKWFNCGTVAILGFGLLWNGLIFGLFVPAFGNMSIGGPDMGFFGVFPMLFLLPFIGAGIFMLYQGLTGLLNTTTITVDDRQIDIRHRPIPHPGKQLAAGEIEQLYVQRHVHRGENSTRYTYTVNVIDYNGKKQKILGGLHDPDQGLYIEQEIERYLGIENRPVRGEYR